MLAIIVGTVISSGVFITLPIVARETGSPNLAALAWLIGGIIRIPQILILAEIGTAYPEQGFGLAAIRAGDCATVYWRHRSPAWIFHAFVFITERINLWLAIQIKKK